jgi:hypothetical protein
VLKNRGWWGAEPPTLYKKGCGGDSHRRDKIAEKQVLGQVYYTTKKVFCRSCENIYVLIKQINIKVFSFSLYYAFFNFTVPPR